MARLPQPGSDSGVWGQVLNDYLSQAHTTDGSLKDNIITNAQLADNSVTAATIADDSITEAQLSPAARTKLNTVAASGAADWSAITNKPAVIAAGADQAAARTSIGAGTSNLTLGSTAGTAAAGNDARLSDARVPTDGSVTVSKLADGAVSEAKLASSVQAKLNAGVADGSVTIAKISAAGTPSGSTYLRGDGVWGTPGGSGGGGTVAWVDVTDKPTTFAPSAHGHVITDISNLQTTLSAKAATSTTVSTSGSLTGGGDLSANRTISLSGDSATPGNSKYYGTNGSGTKGFYDLPAAGGGSVTSSNITDSTAVGRAVLTATDAAAARSAIGAGTSSLTLGGSGSAATASRSDHTHAIADVTNLQSSLNSRPTSSTVTVIWTGTQSAYDAISSKSSTTLYCITG